MTRNVIPGRLNCTAWTIPGTYYMMYVYIPGSYVIRSRKYIGIALRRADAVVYCHIICTDILPRTSPAALSSGRLYSVVHVYSQPRLLQHAAAAAADG